LIQLGYCIIVENRVI